MKKWLLILLLLLIAAGLYLYTYLIPRFQVAAGYSVKCGCTNHFYTDRSLEQVLQDDLAHIPVPISFSTTDTSVTASILGLVSSTAVKKGDLGCVLIRDENDGLPAYKDYGITAKDTLYKPLISTNRRQESTYDYKALDKAIQGAFDTDDRLTDKKTRAVVVLHKGRLVGERYAKGHTKETPMLGWSMTKSITSTLIGLLVKDGKLSVTDKNLFPEWENSNRQNISIEHLLQMESGLDWEEDYTKVSSATEMLFRTDDVVSIARDVPLFKDPGTYFYYSSGSSNLLSGIIKKSFSHNAAYHDYVQKRLFNKIGMSSAFMETDEQGTYIGSSYTYATARDWARYGQLYLQDGVWNGEQILPEGWVSYTRTSGPSSGGIYGAHWRLNMGHKEYKDGPEDLFSANGYQGQRVFVIPSLDLVIVRLGFNSDFDHNTFLKEVCAVYDGA